MKKLPCSGCGKLKTPKDFHRNRAYRRGYCGVCKACKKRQRQAQELKKKYGLTPSERQVLLEAQDGRCAGCRRLVGEFCVDHDHVTGRVRGLLCRPCNFALGHVSDDPATLRRLADYL